MEEGRFYDVYVMGEKLNLGIDCALRWLEHDRGNLVCKHGVAFSILRLRVTEDWSWTIELHDKVVTK